MAGDKTTVTEKQSLKKLYRQFGEKTSVPGIRKVLTTTSTWKRLAWSLVFLCGVGVAAFQFVTTLTDFFSYPVTTLVTMKHESHAPFPGITICNLNRKRKSLIGAELLMQTSGYGEFQFEEAPSDIILNVLIQLDSMTNGFESGHQISDMLWKCLFNREPCSDVNFTQIRTASYGTCYTFNITDPLLQFATNPGPQNALVLELNIEQYEYLPISSKAGVKVIVHQRGESLFPEDGGILAQPGAATSIGIKKAVTHRLPSPYSTCVGANGQGSSQRSLFPDAMYSQKTCMKSCYQMTLYKMCNCCDVDLPCDFSKILNIDELTTDSWLPFCNTSEHTQCVSNIKDSLLRSELDCDERCPLACDRTAFDTVVSAAQWPSDSRIDDFIEVVKNKLLENKPIMNETSLERFVRSNFLRLEIFLDSVEFQEFTTQPKYVWNLMLGTIGGLMGLWLGFSMFTALEIVEVLIDTVIFCTCRRFKKKATLQTEQN